MNSVNFLQHSNTEEFRKVLHGYFAEQIQMYGFDIQYFSRDHSFYDPAGILKDDYIGGFTYGEDASPKYEIPVDMKGLFEVGNDSYLFSMIGVEAQHDGKLFFSKDQFELDMLETSGVITSGHYNEDFTFELTDLDTLDYTASGTLEDFTMLFGGSLDLDIISGDIDQTFVIDPLEITRADATINTSIAGQKNYIKDWIMQGTFEGSIAGSGIDIGDSVILNISGDIVYNTPPTSNESMGWGIAPIVGDFFRLTFPDGTYEDYELSHVTDRDINQDGISPLMEKYIWKCTYVRRTVDHAIMPSGYYEEPIYEDLNNTAEMIDTVEKEQIFDEDTDDDVSYNVYGGL